MVYSVFVCVYHVPGKVGHPVHSRIDSTDKLQVFSFADSLLNEKENKAGRDKGHGEDHTDRHHYICRARHPALKKHFNRHTHTHNPVTHKYQFTLGTKMRQVDHQDAFKTQTKASMSRPGTNTTCSVNAYWPSRSCNKNVNKNMSIMQDEVDVLVTVLRILLNPKVVVGVY